MKSPSYIAKLSVCDKSDAQVPGRGPVRSAAMAIAAFVVLRADQGRAVKCETIDVKARAAKTRAATVLPPTAVVPRALVAIAPVPTADLLIAAVPRVPDSIGGGQVVRRVTGVVLRGARPIAVVRTTPQPTVRARTVGHNDPD